MRPKCVAIVLLLLLVSAPAFGQNAGFEFPPAPAPEEVVPEVVEEPASFDFAAFFEQYLVPLIGIILGLFGGGFGVRLKNKRAKRKLREQADKVKVAGILSMLSSLVPQLHNKVVLGDVKAKKLNVALAAAQKALNEAVDNGT